VLKVLVRVVFALTLAATPAISHAFVTPTSYGAVPNDGIDDWTAFNNAIAAISLTGGELLVPAGDWVLSAPITVLGKPVTIRGEGQPVSIIRFINNTDGIVYNSSTIVNAAFNLSCVSILTSAGGATERPCS
jgi:hypothetical protein